MTIWEAFGALLRRWYVVVAGLLVAGSLLMYVEVQEPVYFSRASAYFFAPSSLVNPNVLRVASLDLVTAAGVVAKRVNANEVMAETASMEVTLFGRGIMDGSAVLLPDNGGQWSVSYNRQELDVQVVAASPEEVQERQSAIFEQIQTELATLQDELGVPPGNRITTEIVPTRPAVILVTGERRRAQMMIVALSAVGVLLAVGMLELRRRERSQLSKPVV